MKNVLLEFFVDFGLQSAGLLVASLLLFVPQYET